MAKVTKASKTTKAKAKPVAKAMKPAKILKVVKPAKTAKPVKSAKKPIVKAAAPKAKKDGTSRRMMSDAKIAKLQKMYESKKHSAQKICDEFGISMATLFNYLKVNV